MWELFLPNHALSKKTAQLLIAGQILFFLLIWAFSPFVYLPRPGEVVSAFADLWQTDGLGNALITSLLLNFEALGVAAVISLGLAYSARMPIMRPIVSLLGKLRFLSMAGLTFVFTLMASNGHQLKLYLLVFSVSVFFVTGMADVIATIPQEKFDLARTLNMGEWRVLSEVVVLGQADKAFDVFRQNAAMGWLLLTMVEGMSRSEGGVGALLLDQNRHFHLAAVFAIQIVILVLGICQDYVIGLSKEIFCPYASMVLEKR